jgi:hypothetical protein
LAEKLRIIGYRRAGYEIELGMAGAVAADDAAVLRFHQDAPVGSDENRAKEMIALRARAARNREGMAEEEFVVLCRRACRNGHGVSRPL